jgi:hypothetical protein
MTELGRGLRLVAVGGLLGVAYAIYEAVVGVAMDRLLARALPSAREAATLLRIHDLAFVFWAAAIVLVALGARAAARHGGKGARLLRTAAAAWAALFVTRALALLVEVPQGAEALLGVLVGGAAALGGVALAMGVRAAVRTSVGVVAFAVVEGFLEILIGLSMVLPGALIRSVAVWAGSFVAFAALGVGALRAARRADAQGGARA